MMLKKKTLRSVAIGMSIGLSVILTTGCATYGNHGGHSSKMHHSDANGIMQTQGLGEDSHFFSKMDIAGNSEQAVHARTYYFALNDDQVNSNALRAIRANARYLNKHPRAKIRIEGYTDERGSREYNIALGERRAKTVASILLNEGVARNRMAVVSFGQEKPVDPRHNEMAWAKNRRSLIVYEQK